MNLHLEKNKYGLRVYCHQCRKPFNEKTLKCGHIDKQVYWSVLYPNNKAKYTPLISKDFDSALIEAIKIKQEQSLVVKENTTEVDNNQNMSIATAAEEYLKYRHGIGVLPQHMKKVKVSKDTKTSIVRHIRQFLDVMKAKNFNIEKMPFADIKPVHVGYWYSWVEEYYGEGSRNTVLNHVRPWFNWIRSAKGVQMIDPFFDVSFEKKEMEIVAITEYQFNSVLEAVDKADPWRYIGCKNNRRHNMYYDWVKDAFKLGLYAGTFRNEELANLKWSNLKINKKTGVMAIVSRNIKVENQLKKEYKPKICVVYPELLEVLKELGMEEMINTDNYIINPKRTMSPKSLSDKMSKCWSHYWKKAHPNSVLMPFKNLRKTYLSNLHNSVGEDMIELSSHSDMNVLNNHYIDPLVAANARGMSIFKKGE